MKQRAFLSLRWLLSMAAVVAFLQGHSQTLDPSLISKVPTWGFHHPKSFGDPMATVSLDLLHMPSPYSYQCLGIFCKAEVKINRWFPIPMMIRVGDVEKAEELDGKGAYHGAPH